MAGATAGRKTKGSKAVAEAAPIDVKKKRVVGTNNPNFTIEEIEDALIRSFGIISSAARLLSAEKHLKVSRQAIHQRIKNNLRLQQVSEDCNENFLDFTENALLQRIQAGDTTAIIYALKCKGKHRGYVERQSIEISGNNGTPIQTIDLSNRSTEELLAIVEAGRPRSDTTGS